MTLFDLLAIVAVLLSVLAGLSNGAVRELVGLFAFGLAVGGAVLLLPLSRPLARATVHPAWAASAVAVVIGFLLLYIGLQVGGRLLTARLRDSGALGSVDRLGGAGIGIARAGVLLGALYLLYRAVTPVGARPPWIEHAALLPVARAAGEALQSLTPKGAAAAGRLGPALRNALSSPDPGVELGDSPPADNRAAEDARASPPHNSSAEPATRSPHKSSTPQQRASHKGLDVMVDRSR